MKKCGKWEYNMDTCCVELKQADGTVIAIDTLAVEREFVETWRSLSRPEASFPRKPCPGYSPIFHTSSCKHPPQIAIHAMYFTVCLCPSRMRFSRSKTAFFVSRTVNTFLKTAESDEYCAC